MLWRETFLYVVIGFVLNAYCGSAVSVPLSDDLQTRQDRRIKGCPVSAPGVVHPGPLANGAQRSDASAAEASENGVVPRIVCFKRETPCVGWAPDLLPRVLSGSQGPRW